jgi:hypothetical protein
MCALGVSTYTAALRHDDSVKKTTLTPAQHVALRDQAAALEASTSSMEIRVPAAPQDAPADTIAIARECGLPLWCDPLPGAARKFAVRAIVTATRACPSRRVFSAGSTSMTRRRGAAARDSSASSSSSWSSIDLTCSPFKGLTTKHERGARRGSGRGGLCLRYRRRVPDVLAKPGSGECARR